MSRSQPTQNEPNPATRFYEWNGESGLVRYYDKERRENVEVPLPFTFILLDSLSTIGGWNDASQSGIYSNEVRDTRTDILVVKSFQGGVIDTGLYKDIKEHVTSKAVGGQFVTNCYIAYKLGKELALGAFRIKGAALGAWMDFSRAHRAELYAGAITIDGYEEAKKGKIVFRTPTFKIVPLSKESNAIAVGLDATLQAYLTRYFARTTTQRVETPPAAHPQADVEPDDVPPSWEDEPSPSDAADLTADDIPF
jgi:hypothetical protein